ncbi:MAG TPA: type II toxin-antitoxin system PemK/MazF family toxin [Anaerolineaceae bacterium]|nr:type II toxin-antitoxin system PemK/MazF family toxin [Anaerolineaceae bacterium]HPN51005.1 type II toxin-antitoxin system PemK/MazF family toxin [Anaerolineaceae bacterium]
MTNTRKITVSLPLALAGKADELAERLHISRSRVVELALEHWLSEDAGETATACQEKPAIHQGDVFWVPLAGVDEVETEIMHPQVVVQDDVLNHSRIQTVVVCGLTSNVQRTKAPGNVLLEAGEAGLPRPSVVVVSQLATVDKSSLGEYIGTLSHERMRQIMQGMRFLQRMAGR